MSANEFHITDEDRVALAELGVKDQKSRRIQLAGLIGAGAVLVVSLVGTQVGGYGSWDQSIPLWLVLVFVLVLVVGKFRAGSPIDRVLSGAAPITVTTASGCGFTGSLTSHFPWSIQLDQQVGTDSYLYLGDESPKWARVEDAGFTVYVFGKPYSADKVVLVVSIDDGQRFWKARPVMGRTARHTQST